MTRAGIPAVLLCCAFVAGACASAPTADPSATAASAHARADSLAQLEALFRARMQEDRLRFTDADARFMTDMIGHHAQALEMARMAPTHGASASVQTLAARILAGQQDEIAIMQQWLRDRGRPVPEAGGHGDHAHHAHGGDDAAAMPGMLSPAQMAALDSARGSEFDRLFLMYMIEHHRGAVVMVDALLASDGAAQDPVVFRLAAEIHAEQTTEIARMQRMLLTLFGGPGTH